MEWFKTFFDRKLLEAGFSEKQIEVIKEILDESCPYCLDGDKSCQCWNDE